jgi:hypothetical protein
MTAMTTHLRRLATAAAAALTLTAAPALAATHYASTAGSASNWPCTTSAHPCDLQHAIDGNGSQKPASGDTVIIAAGTYSFSDASFGSGVPETIEGASGESAPVLNDSFSGSAGPQDWRNFLTINGGRLSHVEINVNTAPEAGQAPVNGVSTYNGYNKATLDDDIVHATGNLTSAIQLTGDTNLLDSVATATGDGTTAVTVSDLGQTGATAGHPGQDNFVLRNVTAYVTGTGGVAVYGTSGTYGYGGGLVPTADCGVVNISLVNVIAEATGSGSSGIDGQTDCSNSANGVLRFDIAYSDYNPSQDVVLPDGWPV